MKGKGPVSRVLDILAALRALTPPTKDQMRKEDAEISKLGKSTANRALHKAAIRIQHSILRSYADRLAPRLPKTPAGVVVREHLAALTGDPINSTVALSDGTTPDPLLATEEDVKRVTMNAARRTIADAHITHDRFFRAHPDQLDAEAQSELVAALRSVADDEAQDILLHAVTRASEPVVIRSKFDAQLFDLAKALHDFRTFIEYESI